MEMNVNICDPKNGKTHKRVLKEDECKALLGKKIGQTIKGELLGLEGYELKIMGGSDNCGFPMRWDVQGTMRKRVLIASGVGIRSKRKGLRKRKNVAGNQVYSKTAQVNILIVKHGKSSLDAKPEAKDDKGDAKEAPKADKPADKPAEKKEAPKEDKPVEKKADKPTKEAPKEDKPVEKKEAPKKDKPSAKEDKEAPAKEAPKDDKPAEKKAAPNKDKPAAPKKEEKPAEKKEEPKKEAPKKEEKK